MAIKKDRLRHTLIESIRDTVKTGSAIYDSYRAQTQRKRNEHEPNDNKAEVQDYNGENFPNNNLIGGKSKMKTRR